MPVATAERPLAVSIDVAAILAHDDVDRHYPPSRNVYVCDAGPVLVRVTNVTMAQRARELMSRMMRPDDIAKRMDGSSLRNLTGETVSLYGQDGMLELPAEDGVDVRTRVRMRRELPPVGNVPALMGSLNGVASLPDETDGVVLVVRPHIAMLAPQRRDLCVACTDGNLAVTRRAAADVTRDEIPATTNRQPTTMPA